MCCWFIFVVSLIIVSYWFGGIGSVVYMFVLMMLLIILCIPCFSVVAPVFVDFSIVGMESSP